MNMKGNKRSSRLHLYPDTHLLAWVVDSLGGVSYLYIIKLFCS